MFFCLSQEWGMSSIWAIYSPCDHLIGPIKLINLALVTIPKYIKNLDSIHYFSCDKLEVVFNVDCIVEGFFIYLLLSWPLKALSVYTTSQQGSRPGSSSGLFTLHTHKIQHQKQVSIQCLRFKRSLSSHSKYKHFYQWNRLVKWQLSKK